MSHTMMCLVPANMDELFAKGVAAHILQRDLDGYWDKVITVHPFAHVNRNIIPFGDNRHLVREYKYPSLSMVKSIIRLIKRGKICVIKAHDPYAMGVIALLLSKICHIPYIIGVYSSYELEWHNTHKSIIWFHWLDNIVAWITFKFADMVFGGSGDAMEWAVRSGAKRSKCRIVRTGGVDEMHFSPLDTRRDLRVELGLVGQNIILYVGRLSHEKFVEDVFDCFVQLKNKDCVLLLASDGELRQGLEAKAHQFGLDGRIRFLGFQPQEKLINLMFTADVIVAPLSGSALVESALSGTPIVAYDVDWHNELIEDEYSGLLVTWRDSFAMATAVCRLLSDKALGKRLGINARNKALQQHGLQNLYKLEAAYFDGLIGARE